MDAPVAPLFDADAVVALNERFAPRVRALWSSLMGEPNQADAEHAVEDRRFAAPAWRELPYFALLKNSYLLYGDYLRELAGLVHLPPQDRLRLQFATRQYVDAIAPTNFPATNPEVL
jgi:polyhydroxyalkanoate synthase